MIVVDDIVDIAEKNRIVLLQTVVQTVSMQKATMRIE